MQETKQVKNSRAVTNCKNPFCKQDLSHLRLDAQFCSNACRVTLRRWNKRSCPICRTNQATSVSGDSS